MQSQATVLQNEDILKIMTVGKVLRFAFFSAFPDFDDFFCLYRLSRALLIYHSCWI